MEPTSEDLARLLGPDDAQQAREAAARSFRVRGMPSRYQEPMPESGLMVLGKAANNIRANPRLLADTSVGRIAQSLARAITGKTPYAGPGLRREDYTDDPEAPQPIEPMINDMGNVADVVSMGSLPSVAMRGAQRSALGVGIPPKANDNAIAVGALSDKIARRENPMATEPFLSPFDQYRLAAAQKRGDQSLLAAEYKLGENPTREQFKDWALRPQGGGLTGEVRGPIALRPALTGVSELQRKQLGPMLLQLEKLGATPEQLRSFTQKEAYDFIKARNFSK